MLLTDYMFSVHGNYPGYCWRVRGQNVWSSHPPAFTQLTCAGHSPLKGSDLKLETRIKWQVIIDFLVQRRKNSVEETRSRVV